MLPALILTFVPLISRVTRTPLLILSAAGTMIHNFNTPSVRRPIFITTPQKEYICSFDLFVLTANGNHLFILSYFRLPSMWFAASRPVNYHPVWNTYLKFCDFYKLQPFPALPSTITMFITLVSFSVKSHHTINNYRSTLRRLHVFCHLDAFDDIHVKLMQKVWRSPWFTFRIVKPLLCCQFCFISMSTLICAILPS